MLKRILLLLMLACLGNLLMAQNDSIKDNSSYLEDGNQSKSNNVLKLNISSFVSGDLTFLYERVITSKFSLEVGVNYLLPHYRGEISDRLQGFDFYEDRISSSGYGYMVSARFFPRHKAPERGFWVLGVQRGRYSINIDDIFRQTDISIGYGYQYILGKRIAVETEFGSRFRLLKRDTTYDLFSLIPLFFIKIKAGYLF